MFMDVDKMVIGQHLSKPGSCWRDFYPMSVMKCQRENCLNSDQDYSYWMTTRVPKQQSCSAFYPDGDIGVAEARDKYISRCVVCVSDYKLVSYHSFTANPPTAPELARIEQKGWEQVYSGYSYIMQVGPGRAFGNAVFDHESCRREFTPTMIAQTYKKDVRFISSNFKSMWLIDNSAQVDKNIKVDSAADRANFIQNYLGKCIVLRRSVERRMYYYSDTPDNYDEE